MPSTYSTGYIPRMWHFEQPTTGAVGQRFVGTSGCLMELGDGARIRDHVQTWASSDCSNKQTIANYGITVLKSTLDCHMPIQSPDPGSRVTIIMMGVDTTEAHYALHASGPGPAGIHTGNCGRIGDTDSVTLNFTTQKRTHLRSVELVGLSSFMWGIVAVYPAQNTGLQTAFVISTSTV